MFHELANYVSDIDDVRPSQLSLSLWEPTALGGGGTDTHSFVKGFQSAPILWAIVGLLGCIFGISVGSFGLYHFYLACKNR